MSDKRFAIYFVPAASTSLYRFGAATIGYDCYGGTDVRFPAGLGSCPDDWSALTRDPRKYGFHATLKAPFRLRDGADENALIGAFERFADECPGAGEFVPQLRVLGGFVAVTPRGEYPAMSELAAACVTAFEPFRAPLTAHERERRIAGGLSERLLTYLDRWGYPYVFDEFRFHMTLTGSLSPDRRIEILLQLQTRFSQALGEIPIPVDRVALLQQEYETARFKVVQHAPIGRARAG